MSTTQQDTRQHIARALANAWRGSIAQASTNPAKVVIHSGDKDGAIDALADFIGGTVQAGQTLLLVVPDDEWLPELSNALDLSLRPLCLVLPGQTFAAGIALRATLALLKSRLSRGVETAWQSAWEAQRARLERHAALWQLTLNWSSAGSAFSAWPAQIDELFPVCILPAIHTEAIAGPPRDLLIALRSERFSSELPRLRKLCARMLFLTDAAAANQGTVTVMDEQSRLDAEYETLAQQLGDMELEFATVQAELAEFTRAYHAKVGARIAELDALQARIASCNALRPNSDEGTRVEAEQARAQAERTAREQRRFADLDRERKEPFAPSTDLKRLFRQLAQKIHPDRADDESDRAWRTELMSEANRAYRAGDEMVLREILSQWQANRTERGTSGNQPTTQSTLARQVARMQRRMAELETELNRLLASRLYELYVASNMARQRGRDLLQEMVEQLDAQIDHARQRLQQVESE